MNITLAQRAESTDNNFNALRLIAALGIVFSHAWFFLGLEQPKPPFYWLDCASFIVLVFFIMSGFLITRSFDRRPAPWRFLWARLLRILPALSALIIATVFVVGPFLTSLSPGAYFGNSQTYRYLWNIILPDSVRTLPGVMDGGVVNISLWTLRYEFAFYLLVLALGVAGLLRRRVFILGIFAVSLLLYGAISLMPDHLFKWLRLLPYFTAGMAAYCFREYIILDKRVFAGAALLLVIYSFTGSMNDVLLPFVLTYIVLYLGFGVHLSGLKGSDISYGIYLWASLALGMLAPFVRDPVLLFLTAGAAVLLPGWLSWTVIEKRVLSFKDIFSVNRFNPSGLKDTGTKLASLSGL